MRFRIIRNETDSSGDQPSDGAEKDCDLDAKAAAIAQELGLCIHTERGPLAVRNRDRPGLVVVRSHCSSEFALQTNRLIADGYKVASLYCGPLSSTPETDAPTVGDLHLPPAGMSIEREVYIATMLLPDDHILSM